MNLDQFGMDTVTFGGSLEHKLQAMREAGFAQVLLQGSDIVGHPGGEEAALGAIRQSGLRIAGLRALHDFEGLTGDLHEYKVDVARSLLELCRRVGAPTLVVASNTSTHAIGGTDVLVRDLRKLATMAIPLSVRIAYQAVAPGRFVSTLSHAWNVISTVHRSNVGLAVSSYHMRVTATPLDVLDELDPAKILLVQLSDGVWLGRASAGDPDAPPRHVSVFPGDGVYGTEVVALVRYLDRLGYRGTYTFDVCNDDCLQVPHQAVAARARQSVQWMTRQVLRRRLPVRPSRTAV